MRPQGEDNNEPKGQLSPGNKPKDEVNTTNPAGENGGGRNENRSGVSNGAANTANADDRPLMRSDLNGLLTEYKKIDRKVEDVKHEVRNVNTTMSSLVNTQHDVETLKTGVQDHEQRIAKLEKLIKHQGSQGNGDQVPGPSHQPAANLEENNGNGVNVNINDAGAASEGEDPIVPQPPPVPVPPEVPPAAVPVHPQVPPADLERAADEPKAKRQRRAARDSKVNEVPPADLERAAGEPKAKRQRRAARDSKVKTKQVIQQGRRKFTDAFREKATRRVQKFMGGNMSLQAAVTATLEKYQLKDIGRSNLMRWVKTEASNKPGGELAKLLAANSLNQKKK